MLQECHVLGYLKRRAEETSYLNHRERSSLLYTLGHLGEEGAEAIHSIISHTYNYRAEVTDRHIHRLPPWPISCPKLRMLHPEAIAFGSCKCEFKLRGRAYPTPVLFALKPSQVPVFKPQDGAAKRVSIPKRQKQQNDSSSPSLESQTAAAEQMVRKLFELKRSRREIDAAIRNLEAELLALFEGCGGEEIELSLGVLKRKKRGDGVDGWDFSIEV